MELDINKESWVPTTLEQVAEWYQRDIPNKRQKEEGITSYVTANHIDTDAISLTRFNELADGQKGPTITKHFEAGDVLLSTRSVGLRKASQAHVSGVTGEKVLVLRPKRNSELLAELFPFILHSRRFWDFAQNTAAGSVNKFTSWNKIKNHEFLLPPKDQQTHLAELLWAAEAQLRNVLDVADRLRTLYAARREFLCFEGAIGSDSEWHSRLKRNVPIETKYSRLGEHLTDIRYGTSKKSNSDKRGTQCVGIPHVLNENLNSEGAAFVELTEKEQRLIQLRASDILIVRTNGNPSYTGRSALVPTDTDLVFASYLIRLRANEEKFDPEFLIRYLQTQTIRKYFRRHATSSAGNYNINTEDIKGVPVPEIDISTQTSIANDLSVLEGNRNSARIAATSSRQLLKSLINQIF